MPYIVYVHDIPLKKTQQQQQAKPSCDMRALHPKAASIIMHNAPGMGNANGQRHRHR
jgi:hypothetical protein